ncbi:MAG: gamma-glutamyl-gamma-aminobutyrate hydrolase family protein, partial [Planctomycetes bacterium]|nr:gamma-glutamyl-gamma-aminobutyrate hydrolase family protein [Planctomycetota bacterium]
MKILLYADSYNDKVGCGVNYLSFAQQFGEVLLATPDNNLNEMAAAADILFIPGGADVDPIRYGERPSPHCGRPNGQYEYLDKYLLDPWLKTNKPIIGVCRGLQALNVAAGGTLWQDLFHHVGGEDRTELGHKIYTNIPNWRIVPVNSYHHQGIKDLAPDFIDIAWATLDKYCPTTLRNKYYRPRLIEHDNGKISRSKETYSCLIEVIQHKTKPWVAFQYHPEDFNCPFAISLIESTLQRYKPEF